MTLGKSFHLSKLWFSVNDIYIIGYLWGLSQIMHEKCLHSAWHMSNKWTLSTSSLSSKECNRGVEASIFKKKGPKVLLILLTPVTDTRIMSQWLANQKVASSGSNDWSKREVLTGMDQSESFPEMYVKLLEREARRRLLEWGQILSSLRLGEKSSDLFSKTEAISNFQQSFFDIYFISIRVKSSD